MSEWYCFKDKVPMVVREIPLTYMDISQSIEGIKCPKCGLAFLTEEKVAMVIDGEKQIESK